MKTQNTLTQIKDLLNKRLGSNVFSYDEDTERVFNSTNRYEGNDIDIEYSDGKIAISITGMTGYYDEMLLVVEKALELYSYELEDKTIVVYDFKVQPWNMPYGHRKVIVTCYGGDIYYYATTNTQLTDRFQSDNEDEAFAAKLQLTHECLGFNEVEYNNIKFV